MKTKTSILPLVLALALPALAAADTLPYRILHSFSVEDGAHENSDGAAPFAGLVKGADGNFYGTASDGGANGNGTIFRVTPDGALTTLYTFSSYTFGTSKNSDGATPNALVLGQDGNFYGTAADGGDNGNGTIFRITSAGSFTALRSFSATNSAGINSDGAGPNAGLIDVSGGTFVGTTRTGGANGTGAVIVVSVGSSSVSVASLHSFSALNNNGANTDGAFPLAGVTLGSDGKFYGTTASGGAAGDGTVYQATFDSFTTLHSFSATNSAGANSDGSLAYAGLIESSGSFYGTTVLGGANGNGTIFRITSAGTLTNLYSFSATDQSQANTDGANPFGALFLQNSSTFYGTTTAGGAGGKGTIYRISIRGDLSVTALHNFAGGDGSAPYAELIKGNDGNFYGTASSGGSNGTGTVFQINILNPVINNVPVVASTVGQPFSFQITATNSPTSFTAASLPAGLSIDQDTGKISGTPTTVGTYSVTVTASNANGSGSAALTIKILPPAPAITSASTDTGTVGKSFSYQITATNNPTKYLASPLPAGLSIDQTTGLISGTPTAAGTYSINLTAINAGGSTGATLTLTIKEAAPVITSATSASAKVGDAFTYQIVATNNPTSYATSSVPPGLTFSTSTGKFTGTLTKAGTYKPLLSATNSTGTGSVNLNLVVQQAAPVITSATSETAQVGVPFSYQITATNSPTSYAISSMPPGLSFDKTTGKLSGTPTKEGSYKPLVAATNSGGTGSVNVAITVKPAKPVITSDLNPPARQGVAFTYQITATNNPTSYATSSIPPGLSFSTSTGKFTGKPTKAGTYKPLVSATNAGGTASVNLNLVVKPPQ